MTNEFNKEIIPNLVQNDELILFSDFLTPPLLETKWKSDNISYYKKNFLSKNPNLFEKVKNTTHYLKFYKDDFKNDEMFPPDSDRLYGQRDELIKSSILFGDFYRLIHSEDNEDIKIMVIAKDTYLLDLVYLSFLAIFPNTYFLDCSDGEAPIRENMKGLVFSNTQALNNSKMSKLMSELIHGEYKFKAALLLSKDRTSLRIPQEFNVIDLNELLPSYKYAYFFLLPMLIDKKLVESFGSEYQRCKFFIERAYYLNTLKDFLKSFQSLKELENSLDSLGLKIAGKWTIDSYDFWYDLLTGNFDDELGLKKKTNDTFQTEIQCEPGISNQFEVIFTTIDKGKWIIIVDGNKNSNTIEPAKDLGINYMLELVRHKKEKISTVELYNSAPAERHKKHGTTGMAWQDKTEAKLKTDKKKKIPLTEDEKRRNSISGAIDTTFIKYILTQKNFRKNFRKHFKISIDVSRFIETIDDNTFKVKISAE